MKSPRPPAGGEASAATHSLTAAKWPFIRCRNAEAKRSYTKHVIRFKVYTFLRRESKLTVFHLDDDKHSMVITTLQVNMFTPFSSTLSALLLALSTIESNKRVFI